MEEAERMFPDAPKKFELVERDFDADGFVRRVEEGTGERKWDGEEDDCKVEQMGEIGEALGLRSRNSSALFPVGAVKSPKTVDNVKMKHIKKRTITVMENPYDNGNNTVYNIKSIQTTVDSQIPSLKIKSKTKRKSKKRGKSVLKNANTKPFITSYPAATPVPPSLPEPLPSPQKAPIKLSFHKAAPTFALPPREAAKYDLSKYFRRKKETPKEHQWETEVSLENVRPQEVTMHRTKRPLVNGWLNG
mmetsp:Transcript_25775/g.29681  ORF Transcript_25775/g.29681 Transcript_25775/m.29681 type:complete len:247 (-) Transcript_25775:37-777(-)